MFTIQKIQIEPLCKHHTLPFTHICVTKYCQCSIKLCEKCCTQHQNDNQNSNLLKINNFYNKVQTQVEILNKQLDKIQIPNHQLLINSINSSKLKFEKFALNQVKILQDSMKYLNQQSSKVNHQIKEASQTLSLKMHNIQLKRKQFPQNYAKKIYQSNILFTMIQFYNQKGFHNFRKKLDKMVQFRGILKDFLTYADKFGKQYEQFLKCSSMTISSELSMKGTIAEILPKMKKTKEISNTDDNFYQQTNSQNEKARQNNLIMNNLQSPTRQKRARTIFGKNQL